MRWFVALVCGVIWAAGMPSAVADDPPVTVVFPELDRFNPASTTYTVDVQIDEDFAGVVRVRLWGESEPQHVLTTSAQVAVAFPTYASGQGTRQVLVESCAYAASCVTVDARSVTVHSSLGASTDLAWDARLAPGEVDLGLSVQPHDVPLEATWDIVRDEAVVASGPATIVERDGGHWLTFSMPDDLQSNRAYLFRAHITTTDFGGLSDTTHPTSFVFDDDADGDVHIPATLALHPVRDGYQDELDFAVGFRNGGFRAIKVDLLTPTGELIKSFGRLGLHASQAVKWDGLVRGKPAPPGDYALHVMGRDPAGNVADVMRTFPVTSQRIQWKTWRVAVNPVSSLMDEFVGSCSTLRKRSGTLGLYSQTKCTRAKQSPVVTVHGVYLPECFGRVLECYRSMQVTVKGGKARGERDAYAVLGYLDKGWGFQNRRVLSGKPGKHEGETEPRLSNLLHKPHDRPYVAWQVGLTDGSRYDVTGYVLQIQYRVLE